MVAALAVAGAVALALVALRAVGVWGGLASAHPVSIEDGRLNLGFDVPGGVAIDTVATSPADTSSACPTVRYEFGEDLTVEAFARECAVDRTLRNGRHGVYRSAADVRSPIAPRTVRTQVGEALVFEQRYEEHTNFGSSWEEPVAVVTLDAPADPRFAAVVVRSDKAALSREELTGIVTSLEPR